MKSIQFKTVIFIISLSAMTRLVFAQLRTDRAVVKNTPSQRIRATATFSTPLTGDLYLATQVNNQLLFFANAGKEITPEPVAYTQDSEYSGQILLVDIPGLTVPSGRYPLYQVVAQPGSNPLNPDNWIGGRSGLSAINFNIGLPCEISGDFDEDGFSDDDLDKDGFHDDDLNRDGFHDDDLDQDGFHDNDFNRDGVVGAADR